MWNTECWHISSSLPCAINVLDLEDPSRAISVGNKSFGDFRQTIFPWCDYTSEVACKAFEVTNLDNGRPFLWIFQEYKTNRICWSIVGNNGDLWGNRQVIKNGHNSDRDQTPQHALDIFIEGDRVWGAPGTPGEAFQPVFDWFISVATDKGPILNEALGQSPDAVKGLEVAMHRAELLRELRSRAGGHGRVDLTVERLESALSALRAKPSR